MGIAIISYDKKFLDSLPKTDEIKAYNDTLSLIKDYQDHLKTIIYDSSSGIFAEDDLKYLISKLANTSIKYFVLTVPENLINESSFDDNVIFIPKTEFPNLLPDIVKDAQQDKNQQEEVLDKHISKIGNADQNINNLVDLGHDIIPIEEPVIDKENTLDSLYMQHMSEPMPEFEYGNIEYGDICIDNKNTLDDNIGGELESFKEDVWHVEENQSNSLPIDESLLQRNYPDFAESNEFCFEEKDKVKESQNYIEHREEEMEEKELTTTTEEPIIEPIIQKTETGSNFTTKSENKTTVANFNVSISSEDIKKLAMEMVKDMLKNDDALQTIIDHIQIDFQDEAMKEMEKLKNRLMENVRQEAEVIMKQEIEKIIKDELKDYVETITAKIVREKLDAIFNRE